ncbi:MAG: aminomethyl-transferring glycine dehydrogenase subunit GcvPB [Eubacteriaceae bacterium]|jgi:glycine dehydrogenase subunit 2|nr:aminomethyl-transferring glycine dehydrogenase subunit GcvPB [Eubacteriaceae bacterium]
MKTIFESSVKGRKLTLLPESDVPAADLKAAKRETPLGLPEVSENDISRHFSEMAKATHGVNDGFYPLGSCTMKYNPKVNDEAASLPGFTNIHPLQPDHTVQGCIGLMKEAEATLCEITGMDRMTFQPAAGAHGEFTGLLLIKAYHRSRHDLQRNKIIVPDSAHGTNPASAVMAGYEVINIPSQEDGCVDLEALRNVVGDDTAGLMLTNPNTVGLFDKNILEITEIVHKAGGLCYYDGANLNAVIGIVRPGDMGFDCMHINLHKTFSTPHGGGGPGAGPVGCKAFLADFLPGMLPEGDDELKLVKPEKSIGMMKAFNGNFLILVRAYAYLIMLGREGIPEIAKNAVLNANYLRVMLAGKYVMPYKETCMHEFVMSLEHEKASMDVTAMDVAKALLDYGIHPPTMYFPLIVHEALMVEPTETESKETLDSLINAFTEIYDKALEDPEYIKSAPHKTIIERPDEVSAARHPKLRYIPEDK